MQQNIVLMYKIGFCNNCLYLNSSKTKEVPLHISQSINCTKLSYSISSVVIEKQRSEFSHALWLVISLAILINIWEEF